MLGIDGRATEDRIELYRSRHCSFVQQVLRGCIGRVRDPARWVSRAQQAVRTEKARSRAVLAGHWQARREKDVRAKLRKEARQARSAQSAGRYGGRQPRRSASRVVGLKRRERCRRRLAEGAPVSTLLEICSAVETGLRLSIPVSLRGGYRTVLNRRRRR